MRAGRRDRYITFQRYTESRDSLGDIVKTWATLRSEFAEVVPFRGNEALRFERQVSDSASKFITSYFTGLTANDRISYNSEFWDILYISEIGRREGLEIIAQILR